jgi:hypothetical protein
MKFVVIKMKTLQLKCGVIVLGNWEEGNEGEIWLKGEILNCQNQMHK